MGIEIRQPRADETEAVFHADGRAFGFHYTPERISESQMIVDLARYRIALDGGDIVGVIGSYALDVTLPGGSTGADGRGHLGGRRRDASPPGAAAPADGRLP
ncbi:MAG: GNAT family N-acetyltransferase [Ilumatobacteraceae bacterium]